MNSNLPPNWSWVKLGDVCFTTSGGTPSRGNSKYYNGTIPWVKSGELDKGLILDTEEKISEEALKNSSAKIFSKGTLLIALYGATIGKLAFLGIDAATNQAVCGIFKNENIDSNFLSNFLFFKKSYLVKQSIGGAQPNISQGILKNLEIPFPPLPEQKKIVEKIEELFSGLDSGVASLKKAKAQIRLYRQSVLASAFSGKLLTPSAERIAQSEMLKAAEPKVDYSNQLPDGWKRLKLGEVTLINPRLPFELIDGNILVTFLPMRQVEELTGKFDLSMVRNYSEVKKGFTPFTNGDVIFAKITPCMENGKIAVLSNLKNKIGFGSTEFHVFRTKNELNNHYLFYFLIQESFRAKAQHNMTGAVGQKRVPKRFLEESEISLPPILQQTKIVEEIEKRFSEADNLEKAIDESLAKSETLRQSILKQAFEGRLV